MLQKNTRILFAVFFLALIILIQVGCKKNDAVTDNGTPVLEIPVITNDAIKVTATINRLGNR